MIKITFATTYNADFSQIFSEYNGRALKLNYVQKFISIGCIDKVFVGYVTTNPKLIS